MSGLIALLDDVAGIAKVAAASIDDVAGMSVKASAKAAGAVIDDAAVTPKYVHGFDADREVPIVWKIAKGSIFNKIVILLPVALLLSAFAPWAISPLLMLGGGYLCFEGAEKVWHAFAPGGGHEDEDEDTCAEDPAHLEESKVAGAIKTDFILSAEIMTIALNEVTRLVVAQGIHGPLKFAMEAAALAFVAMAITGGVYGFVALIVKVDDYGLSLARTRTGLLSRAGCWLVRVMPRFMAALTIIGTAAMIWVGGSIVLHGLHDLGLHQPYEWIQHRAAEAAAAMPGIAGLAGWFVTALFDGIFGLVLGLLLLPVANGVIAPLWSAGRRAFGRS
ncbi:DUF808 domain-containing protein [Paracoccus contaminans]|uniref:ABC transporter n=1 Tax=Paracoccus contaminans TaxID=1945662 RepID=A0A1W6CTY1_9RHOB|nr:DUF808 domain-containing protein [Paracoccus contaminans]ARJ68333.1 ABC transporter [Paracoccus contaminans]